MKTSKQVLTNIFVEGRIYQDIDLQHGSALQRVGMVRVLLGIDKISKNWFIQQLAD